MNFEVNSAFEARMIAAQDRVEQYQEYRRKQEEKERMRLKEVRLSNANEKNDRLHQQLSFCQTGIQT